MSFHEINIAIRAENRASYAFRAIGGDLISLGHSFGLLDSSMGRAVSAFMTTIHLLTSLRAVLTTTAGAQTAHATALGGTALAHGVAAGAAVGHQTTLMAYTGVAITATGVTHGLRAALTALAFSPLGLILGLAMAIGSIAYASNAAADASRRLNEELDRTGEASRSIRRSGEADEAALLRRGVD